MLALPVSESCTKCVGCLTDLDLDRLIFRLESKYFCVISCYLSLSVVIYRYPLLFVVTCYPLLSVVICCYPLLFVVIIVIRYLLLSVVICCCLLLSVVICCYLDNDKYWRYVPNPLRAAYMSRNARHNILWSLHVSECET